MSFGEFILYVIYVFFFVFYLMVVFYILTDLFRDHEMSGWAKALWILALLLFFWIAPLVYLIVRGRGMSERARQAAQEQQQATVEAARSIVAATGGQPTSPADQIAQAKSLLDTGAITQDEFNALKAKALS